MPLDDQQDFLDARRGLLLSEPGFVVPSSIPGAPAVWKAADYDFVQGEAPPTVNPSLWRQAKLNAQIGLFKVVEGVWQLRGFDIGNMTLVQGRSGWIVIDALTCRETAATALAFARKHLGDQPVTALLYTHSHVDHFGGAAVGLIVIFTGFRVVWDTALDPLLAARCGLEPGARLKLGEETLALKPVCVNDEADMRLRLVLAWPDGRQSPLSEVVRVAGERGDIGSPASHVLVAGAFHAVHDEPPAEVLRALGHGGGLALRRDDRGVLEHLAERFESVREALQPFTRRFPAQPAVCLDLRDDDWLRVRLFAHAGDGAWDPTRELTSGERLFAWSPDAGWERVEGPGDRLERHAIRGPGEDDDEWAAPAEMPAKMPHSLSRRRVPRIDSRGRTTVLPSSVV